MRYRKQYGPMRATERTDWKGDTVYRQSIEWVDADGKVVKTAEREVLATGERPHNTLHYDSRGIV